MALQLSESAAFSQQGTVDWVQLSNSTVSATVAVFSRLAAANIDPQTLAVGHALCSTFKLSTTGLSPQRWPVILPHPCSFFLYLRSLLWLTSYTAPGQQRMQHALKNLKWCSSFGDVMWFGFGMRHPIRLLAQTMNGYSLLMLCASLSEISVNLEAAALILAELVDIQGAPQELRPSIQQWHALATACSGVLANTTFSCVTDHFVRLARDSSPWKQVGDLREVAKALRAISQLSTGALTSITLIGNSTCGWIAALGHYFFSLDVELRHASGELLFRTASERNPVHISVVYGDPDNLTLQLMDSTYMITDAHDLLSTNYPLPGGRIPWDGVLGTAYGRSGESLIRT